MSHTIDRRASAGLLFRQYDGQGDAELTLDHPDNAGNFGSISMEPCRERRARAVHECLADALHLARSGRAMNTVEHGEGVDAQTFAEVVPHEIAIARGERREDVAERLLEFLQVAPFEILELEIVTLRGDGTHDGAVDLRLARRTQDDG